MGFLSIIEEKEIYRFIINLKNDEKLNYDMSIIN